MIILRIGGLFLLLLPLFTCNQQKTSIETTDEETTTIVEPNPDSLRQAYLRHLQEKSDTMPVAQIKEAGKIYPVDEALLDTAFFVFREDLLEAVVQKDIFEVLEVVDENIKVSFGSTNGLAGFVSVWELDSEDKIPNSGLWEVLRSVLQGGGVFQQGGQRFIAPYLFATFPDEYDGFRYGAVTGAGVRLRATPSLNSRIKTVVSHDIVEILKEEDKTETIDGETHPWVHIKKLDGTEGYIWGKFIGRPIGYRAGFRKENGEWKMDLLVAGD